MGYIIEWALSQWECLDEQGDLVWITLLQIAQRRSHGRVIGGGRGTAQLPRGSWAAPSAG